MTICPNCGTENIHGALMCAKCYTLLVKISLRPQELTISPSTRPTSPEEASVAPDAAIDTSTLKEGEIMLRLRGTKQIIVLKLEREVILGRPSEKPSPYPLIDLSIYNARQHGVSRFHAILRRGKKGVEVEDLGSSNGAWLSSIQLHPYVPIPVKSGDVLRLGTMELEIFMPQT